MIDTNSATPLPLSVIAQEIPNRRGSKGVDPGTINRWTITGVRGVKLETVLIGGIRMTTRSAVARFFEQITIASQEQSRIARPRLASIVAL